MGKRSAKINWSDEMADAARLVGKAVLKFLGWVLSIFMTLALVGVITGTIVGGAFLLYAKNYLDTGVEDFDALLSEESRTTTVSYVDKNGQIVEIPSERLSAEQNRVWVKYSEMNDYIRDAFVAIEDKRFYSHQGVDWIRTARVTLDFLTGSGSAGGSTITQQLIKNVTGDDDVTIQRKAQEIFKALNLEKKYDKSEILEMYLNVISLSHGCYGVGAAAYKYFGKEVADLTLIESAAIAGITQSPYYYDPIYFPEHNAEKRNIVLQYMYDQGMITQEEFISAYQKELVLNISTDENAQVSTNIHSWYTDAARQEAVRLLQEEFGYTATFAEKVLLTGGFNIVTAQDPEIQSIVEEFYEGTDGWQMRDNSPIQPESSCVIIDPYTGNVVALVGGRGQKTINLGLNYATQTKRPPGSSLKPVSVYGPALEKGLITYGSVLDDAPINFGTEKIDPETGKKTYSNSHGYPKNSPDRYRGLSTINEAIRVSINTIAWRTLSLLGLENSYEFLTEKVGISTLVNNQVGAGGAVFTDVAFAPLALGQLSYGVTVKELTAAYQIFVNGGIYNEERLVLQILDSEGEVVIDNEKKSTIVISAETASIMTKMMQEVVKSGTAKALTIDKYVNCAGKTGTTENDQDRWFVGYNPYYVCGIWFGYSMPRPLKGFSSGSPMPVLAWDKIMTKVLQKYIDESKTEGGAPLKTFEMAPGIVTATYCKDSGKLMTDACRADPRGSRAEIGYFKAGTEPTEACDVHVLVNYDSKTKAIAVPGCPEENITQVGLLNIYRQMPFNIKITDAEYTMQALPFGYSYGGLGNGNPYYFNMLPPGFYSGYGSSKTSFYNHVCTLHRDNPVETEPPPVTPPETDPETPEQGEAGPPT